MFFFRQFTAVVALLAAGIEASPLGRRDVITPKITSPTKDSVWPVGSTQTVTWDTSDFPPVSQITNIIGKVILGFDENDSLNLDFEHPLASNFNLTDGSVKLTVPDVQPRDDYLIVLFGDSGNTSPSFSITKISSGNNSTTASPSSAAVTATGTLITTPIPITGSVITGGTSPSSTDTANNDSASTTGTPTDANVAPLSTPTAPTTAGTGTAAAASTVPTSAAWSIRDPASLNFKAFSLCSALIVTFLVV
ncbi:hypothetical protein D9619_007420 [Psilocybe cf. subviscida]|uniref:Yeast cell wall synthesis Kre9/Knh1-like N-terminal domain-containing protein n=1 Tax=Psilocybe cf. subviscida TaxID=2480587 RepID=A0A8H5B2M1_9AGAR|nr:hypothetical protein D9619_007420 [Psilocybe cf. subviscida]